MAAGRHKRASETLGKTDRMTSTKTIPFERIRERAYELWDRNHRPEGLDIQFWLLAERELKAVAKDEAGQADMADAPRDGSAS
jgi:hypothetical protein